MSKVSNQWANLFQLLQTQAPDRSTLILEQQEQGLARERRYRPTLTSSAPHRRYQTNPKELPSRGKARMGPIWTTPLPPEPKDIQKTIVRPTNSSTYRSLSDLTWAIIISSSWSNNITQTIKWVMPPSREENNKLQATIPTWAIYLNRASKTSKIWLRWLKLIEHMSIHRWI